MQEAAFENALEQITSKDGIWCMKIFPFEETDTPKLLHICIFDKNSP